MDTPSDACWGIGAVSSATSTSNAVWVTCPAGEKVLGGGCKDSTNTTLLRTTRPHGVDGWACEFAAASGGLSAHAICAAGDLDIGLQVAVKTSTTTPTPAVTVKCPSPKKVVGGGCADNFSGTSLVTTEPYLDAGWTCAFRTNPGSISAYAVCEDP